MFIHVFFIFPCVLVVVRALSSGQLTRLEEDAPEIHKSNKNTQHTSAMTVTSAALGSSVQTQKKQVKRRHRRKRNSCTAVDCVENSSKQEQTDRSDRSLSSDRSEKGETRERCFRIRKELPPRLRCSGAPQSESTSEDEAWRQARSWSKEKARRARRRSGSSREREVSRDKGGEDVAEVMELQSMGSEDGKENHLLVENSEGLKKRHSSSRSSTKSGNVSQRERSPSRDDKNCSSYKSHSPEGSSSAAEDAEELITKRYQERGAGDGDMSVPAPQKHCTANGGAVPTFSDDSELEVCR